MKNFRPCIFFSGKFHPRIFGRKSTHLFCVMGYTNPTAFSAMLGPMKKYQPTMFSPRHLPSTISFLRFNGKLTSSFCAKIAQNHAQNLSGCCRMEKISIQCIWCSRYTARQEYPSKLSGMKKVFIGGKISGSHCNFAPPMSARTTVMVAAISYCAREALCVWLNPLRLSVVENNHKRTLCLRMKPKMNNYRLQLLFDSQIIPVK